MVNLANQLVMEIFVALFPALLTTSFVSVLIHVAPLEDTTRSFDGNRKGC